MLKQVGISLLLLTTALPRPSHGDCTAAALFGGVVGLFIGSSMQAHANCQKMDRAGYQRHLMQEVLQNYDARRHCEYVEYVTIDLEGWLNPHQQQQLLDIMQQRRNCYLQDAYLAR